MRTRVFVPFAVVSGVFALGGVAVVQALPDGSSRASHDVRPLDREIEVSGIPSGWEQWDPGGAEGANGETTSYSAIFGDDGTGDRRAVYLCFTYEDHDMCSTGPERIIDKRHLPDGVVLVILTEANSRNATDRAPQAWRDAPLKVTFNEPVRRFPALHG